MLARSLASAFYDLDACLCQRQGKSVAEIVSERGWEAFRRLETETLRAVTAEAPAGSVVATGGGAVIAPENRRFMRDHGLVFWLHAPEEVLAGRLMANPMHGQRPSLTGRGLLEELAATMHEREAMYASCSHHKVDATLSMDAVCASIIAKISAMDGHGKA